MLGPSSHRRILSLDGGGVRGLSSLLILRDLMRRLESHSGHPARPCDYFDLIIGAGMGGISALFLGRLGMTVDQAIDEYIRLAETAFQPVPLRKFISQKSLFDGDSLEDCLAEIVQRHLGDPDATLADLSPSPFGCQTIVLASKKATSDSPTVVFRSFAAEFRPASERSIHEIGRATVTLMGAFAPVTLRSPLEVFVEERLAPFNNPAAVALEEAASLWPESRIDCSVSLGTGLGRIVSADSRWDDVAEVSRNILLVCEYVHNDMLQRQSNSANEYFRFNVNRGLDAVDIAEWMAVSTMISATDAWTRTPGIDVRLETCVQQLLSDRLAERAPDTIENEPADEQASWTLPSIVHRSLGALFWTSQEYRKLSWGKARIKLLIDCCYEIMLEVFVKEQNEHLDRPSVLISLDRVYNSVSQVIEELLYNGFAWRILHHADIEALLKSAESVIFDLLEKLSTLLVNVDPHQFQDDIAAASREDQFELQAKFDSLSRSDSNFLAVLQDNGDTLEQLVDLFADYRQHRVKIPDEDAHPEDKFICATILALQRLSCRRITMFEPTANMYASATYRSAKSLVERLHSTNDKEIESAAREMAEMTLSKSACGALIAAGVLPSLVSLLSETSSDDVVQPAAGAIRNIAACGTAIDEVISAGCFRPLIRLLSTSSHDGTLEQVAGAISNMARASRLGRATAVAAGSIPPLVRVMSDSTDDGVLEQATGAIKTITEHSVSYQRTVAATEVLSPLIHLLSSTSHHGVLTSALGAIRNITNLNFGRNDQVVVGAEALPPLIQILSTSPYNDLLEQATISIDNMTASAAGKELVIAAGALLPLVRIMSTSSHNGLLEVAAKAIKHIVIAVTGKEAAITAGVFPALTHTLSTTTHDGVLEQAASALATLIYSESSSDAAISAGVLSPSIRILSTSSHSSLLEPVAAVIGNIAVPKAGKHAAVAAGALPPLIQLLSASSHDVLEEAARSISNLADDDVICDEVVTAGALPLLIQILSTSSHDGVLEGAAAATAILAASRYMPDLVAAGSVQPLTRIISTSTQDSILEHALRALWDITVTRSGSDSLVDAGALPTLVRLLSSVTFHRILEPVTGVIRNITVAHSGAVVAVGALTSLIRAISRPSTQGRALEHALIAIGNITDLEPGSEAALAAGVLPVLLSLLSNSFHDSVLTEALSIIQNVARWNSCRDMVIATGILPPLVQILSTSSHNVVLKSAAGAIANIVHSNLAGEAAVAAGALQPLIRILAVYSEEDLLKELSGAIGNITNSQGGSEASVSAGALPILVQVLSTSSHDSILEHIAKSMRNISYHHSSRDGLLTAGALAPLVNLLSTSSDDNVLEETTAAIQNFTLFNKPGVLAAGAIPPLVQLISTSTRAEILRHATEALFHLSTVESGMDSIIAAGALPPLVRLLSNWSSRVRGNTVAALRNMSDTSDSCTEHMISSTGAISALVALLNPTSKYHVVEDVIAILLMLAAKDKHADGLGEALKKLTELQASTRSTRVRAIVADGLRMLDNDKREFEDWEIIATPED